MLDETQSFSKLFDLLLDYLQVRKRMCFALEDIELIDVVVELPYDVVEVSEVTFVEERVGFVVERGILAVAGGLRQVFLIDAVHS